MERLSPRRYVEIARLFRNKYPRMANIQREFNALITEILRNEVVRRNIRSLLKIEEAELVSFAHQFQHYQIEYFSHNPCGKINQTVPKCGDRVRVFDNSLFINDWLTPLAITRQQAVVTDVSIHPEDRRTYVSVRFEHDSFKSEDHGLWGIEII